MYVLLGAIRLCGMHHCSPDDGLSGEMSKTVSRQGCKMRPPALRVITLTWAKRPGEIKIVDARRLLAREIKIR